MTPITLDQYKAALGEAVTQGKAQAVPNSKYTAHFTTDHRDSEYVEIMRHGDKCFAVKRANESPRDTRAIKFGEQFDLLSQ